MQQSPEVKPWQRKDSRSLRWGSARLSLVKNKKEPVTLGRVRPSQTRSLCGASMGGIPYGLKFKESCPTFNWMQPMQQKERMTLQETWAKNTNTNNVPTTSKSICHLFIEPLLCTLHISSHLTLVTTMNYKIVWFNINDIGLRTLFSKIHGPWEALLLELFSITMEHSRVLSHAGHYDT